MIIKKVYISICSRRAPEWGMIIKIQQAMQYAAGFGITCTLSPRVGESLICRARQNSLIAFMDTDCDYLLTIDDDVETPEHAIVKLIQDNKDIVGGFYRLKQDDRAVTAVRIPGKPDFPEILKKKLLTPAVYVSTGMMLVKRRVIEAMTAAYPSLHYTQNRTGTLSRKRSYLRSIAGALSGAGTLLRSIVFKRLLSGEIGSQGIVARILSSLRRAVGAVSTAGMLFRKTAYQRRGAGNIGFSGLTGGMIRVIQYLSAVGILWASGVLSRTVVYRRQPSGETGAQGAAARRLSSLRSVVGHLSSAGSLLRRTTYRLKTSGAITSFIGSIWARIASFSLSAARSETIEAENRFEDVAPEDRYEDIL
jgi:hypothetical protein